MDGETYRHLLTRHGRRIANRAAFASLRENGYIPCYRALMEAVVNMYGPEDHLPIEERSQPVDPGLRLDPLLMFKLYPDDWTRRVIAARRIKGTSKDWAAEIPGTEPSVLRGILRIITGDGRVLDWMERPEGAEWREFDDSLNEADMLALRLLLSDGSSEWPAPGSPEAEAWLKSRRKE